jgi:hypothetical protein
VIAEFPCIEPALMARKLIPHTPGDADIARPPPTGG